MNEDTLKIELAAAINEFLRILADHGFILDAESDAFIKEPVHGAYTILLHAMLTIDPHFPRIERLDSTLGPDETFERLESQLLRFSVLLESLCANYEAVTGVDPIHEPLRDEVALSRVAQYLE